MQKNTTHLFLALFVLFFLWIQQTEAQDVYFIRLPHSTSGKVTQNTRLLATEDTLQLPFFDNFNFHESDKQPLLSLWKTKSGVYVNNHYPVNQPEFNVATFDGLNAKGQAYNWVEALINNNLSKSGVGDVLISKPIDLSRFKDTSKIGLSFIYQLGAVDSGLFPLIGRGYLLKLYFLDKKGKYNLIFPTEKEDSLFQTYSTTTPFFDKFISITDSNYLYKGFRFKFEITGSTTSNLDMWSIDDVYLDSNRTNANVPDIGFSATPSSFLKTYHAIPFRHFKNSGLSFLKDSTYSIINNIALNDTLFIDPDTVSIEEVISGSFIQKNRSENNDFPNAGIIYPKTQFKLPFVLDKNNLMSQLNGLNQNSAVIKNTFKFKRNTFQFGTENDSISRITYLDQYYAYDDGTAEIAGGAGGENQYAQIATKYDLLEDDTLTTIYIHFPKYTYNHTGESVTIKVWKFLNNVDGAKKDSLLYTNFYNITYVDSLMYGFHAYRLDKDILLSKGSFYIGFEYTSPKRLYIGIDVSNNSMNKCYTNLNYNGWSQSFTQYFDIKGSLMIRPKFGTKKDLIQAIEERSSKNPSSSSAKISLFPNPSTNKITIESELPIQQIAIYSIQGLLIEEVKVKNTTSFEYHSNNLTDGIYLVKINTNKGSESVKFIKE